MPEPITLTIELDLDKHLATHHGYDEDGESMQSPTTIEDLIFEAAARELARSVSTERRRDLANMAQGLVRESAHAFVDANIADVLEKSLQRTNTWGVPEGEPTTLHDVIVEHALKYLKTPVEQRNSRDTRKNPVDAYIADEVAKAVKAELKDALDEARKQVRDAVTAQAAVLITDTLAQAAGTKL